MISKHHKKLGLNAKSTEREIKRAYRKKVMRIHPDVNDSPNAENDFISLTQSYEYLLLHKSGKAPVFYEDIVSKAPTYYQNSRYTTEEMEAAWAKARNKAKEEYIRYQRRPWYHPEKIGDYILMVFSAFLVILLLVPLIILEFYLLFTGNFPGFFALLVIVVPFGYQFYNALKK